MSNLQKWENIIKEKRKKTLWRQFIMQIASWRSLNFYKNSGLISRFPQTERVNIQRNEEYNENYEQFLNNGISYRVGDSFFELFGKLFNSIRHSATLSFLGSENCEFADQVFYSKNIYLSFIVIKDCENVCYSLNIKGNVENVFNSSNIFNNSNNIYFCFGVHNSSYIFYSTFINNSNNVWFSSNLTGCTECIMCNDLVNESYCIENKKYEKGEYFEKKQEILKQKTKFTYFYSQVNKFGKNYNAYQINGNYIVESENIENGYIVASTKNGRNLVMVNSFGEVSEMHDVCAAGGLPTNNYYGVLGGGGGSYIFNSCHMLSGSHIYYSYFLENCSFCLGCIGLKNKSFCILNKQYSKEEWYELADKIFAQMDKDGTLGEFFPGSLNPFYFNDTMAYLIDDSFTKEEVEKEGYMWRDDEIKVDIPENAEIVSMEGNDRNRSLQEFQGYDETGNWQINPEIMKKVIKDEKGNYYRIVKMEYDFLMKHGLPLPEIHWLDRIKLGFKFK